MKPIYTLSSHKVDDFNRDHIRISRERGLGDPCIEGKAYSVIFGDTLAKSVDLKFHEGPEKEGVVNGITNEALLAIVIDRLECFQRGAYRCRQNALALTKLEEAMHWLGARSADRERRGVEGKNEP